MENKYSLEELLEPINAGEYELKKWLRAQSGIESVKDVSDNPLYWYKDIDLIVYPKNAPQYSIEVKWDSVISKTGNLFIETLSDISNHKEGWFLFCQANYLFYGDAAAAKFYIFNFEELKKYILDNAAKFNIRSAADYGSNGIKKYSEGYLVPISQIQNLIVKEIYI